MPNYKCISPFKSFHGKLFKEGDILASKYYDVMEEQDKAHFEKADDAPDKPIKTENLFVQPESNYRQDNFYMMPETKKPAEPQPGKKEFDEED